MHRLAHLVDEIVRVDTENHTGFPTQVALCGPIAAGKSATISLLREALAAEGFVVRLVREELPPELFGLFLADPEKYADDFQLYMAHMRAAYAVAARYVGYTSAGTGGARVVVLHERTIMEDGGFFDVNVQLGRIPKERRAAYERATSDARARCLADTHLFVMLSVPFETTRARMVARNRTAEGIDASEREAYDEQPYFKMLYEWYANFADALGDLAPGRVHVYDNAEHSPLHLSAASIE